MSMMLTERAEQAKRSTPHSARVEIGSDVGYNGEGWVEGAAGDCEPGPGSRGSSC